MRIVPLRKNNVLQRLVPARQDVELCVMLLRVFPTLRIPAGELPVDNGINLSVTDDDVA